MNTETSLAFERTELRAEAHSKGDPLDRISVRDYTLEVEIGAFQAERGVTQRIRVNVVLEVSRHVAAKSDDVDRVLSYDTITEAIEAQLSTERLNLLETFAERIAERILTDPRAVRVFIRIEKLDRIPGALGVEIVRTRSMGETLMHPVSETPVIAEEKLHPLVVFLPNAVLDSAQLPAWLEAIANHALPAIICVEAVALARPLSKARAANRRIALLSIEQNAWVLAGCDPRCVVVDSRTELDWALKHNHLSVWAPSKIVLDAVHGPGEAADTPLKLARWFASEFSAAGLTVLGATSDLPEDITQIATPAEL